MGERLPGNAEEGRSTLWEGRRVVILVVSMLGCLECDGFRAVVLIESVSGNLCGLVEHKLGESEEHELGPPTPRDDDDVEVVEEQSRRRSELSALVMTPQRRRGSHVLTTRWDTIHPQCQLPTLLELATARRQRLKFRALTT